MLIQYRQKPQDVSDPEKVDTSNHRDTIAFSLMHSKFTEWEYQWMCYATKSPTKRHKFTRKEKVRLLPLLEGTNANSGFEIVDLCSRSADKTKYQALACGSALCSLPWKWSDLVDGKGLPGRGHGLLDNIFREQLSPSRARRWHHAQKGLQRRAELSGESLEGIKIRPRYHRLDGLPTLIPLLQLAEILAPDEDLFDGLLVPSAPNFPRQVFGDYDLASFTNSVRILHRFFTSWVDIFYREQRMTLLLLTLLPLVYGGIHLMAWNFEFASTAENKLWKVAAITIMVGFQSFVTLNNLECLYSFALSTLDALFDSEIVILLIYWLICVIFLVLVGSTIIFYALSRVYLVVESFISLRHVPIGAYAAIPWVQAIPHI